MKDDAPKFWAWMKENPSAVVWIVVVVFGAGVAFATLDHRIGALEEDMKYFRYILEKIVFGKFSEEE